LTGLADPILCVEQLPEARDLPPLCYLSDQAAGLDLRAAVTTPTTLVPGASRLLPTGIRIALPPGYEGQVRPRSGLASEHGVTVLNTPGTIDADYRGEVCVLLVNHGPRPVVINRGDRIAQLVVAPVTRVRVKVVEQLNDTARGSGGFGHTGR
jgi:dUTP pyrophosphatase